MDIPLTPSQSFYSVPNRVDLPNLRHDHDDGLLRGPPSENGVNAAGVLAFLDDLDTAGLDLHGMMLYRNGKVLVEGWAWPYGAARPRVLHSIAKSFTACAIGLAIDEGLLSLDDEVHAFFPECFPGPVEPRLASMTIEHLLTMRTGHEFNVSGSVWRAIPTSWIAEFFKIPLAYEPGSRYVYTSAASYMLSAIITRITGVTMHAYLRPRLLDPLGIHGETWEPSPDGVTPGGNGLTARTSDLLKLGILHAQNGEWQGRTVLPAAWVAAATRAHGDPQSEYGYHWWRRPQVAFSAIGVFVQMGIVYPEHGVTLVIIAGMKGSSEIRPHLERRFPEAFTSCAGDSAADARLLQRLAAWRMPPILMSSAAPGLDEGAVEYAIEPNETGITRIGFSFNRSSDVTLTITDASGEKSIVMGLDGWIEGRTSMPGRDLHHGYELVNSVVVAGARWRDAQALEMIWIFAETAFRDTVICEFDDDRLQFKRRVNVNSGRLEDRMLTGRRIKR